MIILGGQGDLLEVVRALGPVARLPRRLDGRQEQGDQDRDDGDHDEEFDQRETVAGRQGLTNHVSKLPRVERLMNRLHDEGEVRLIYLPIPTKTSNMSDAKFVACSRTTSKCTLEMPERLVNY